MKISWNKSVFNKLGCNSTPIPDTAWENLPLCPHLEHCLLSQGLSFVSQYPVILHDWLDFIQMCSDSTVTHLNNKFSPFSIFNSISPHTCSLPWLVLYSAFWEHHWWRAAAIFSTIKQLNTVQNVLIMQAFFLNYSGLFSSDWQTSLSLVFTVCAFKGPLKNKIKCWFDKIYKM